MFFRTYTIIGAVVASSLSLPVFAQSDMYDRVCPRVINRFLNDAKMWDRVNERIEKRFGFVCNSVAPVKASSSSSSRKAIEDNSETFWVPQTSNKCTASIWECESWGYCAHGRQTRKCDINYHKLGMCLDPEGSHPIEIQNCVSITAEEKTKWDKFHEEIIDAAKELTRQGPQAKDCFNRLVDIETSFVKFYNSCNELGEGCSMLEVAEKDFAKAPKVCF